VSTENPAQKSPLKLGDLMNYLAGIPAGLHAVEMDLLSNHCAFRDVAIGSQYDRRSS